MAELMKGKVWGERKHLVKYPVIAEIKYDEIRCHVKLTDDPDKRDGEPFVDFISYAGKPLNNLWYWAEQFKLFMLQFQLSELDVGVVVNNNFNDSYRWVRSIKTPPGLDAGMVNFMLFDMPSDPAPFIERQGTRLYLARKASDRDIPIMVPEFRICHNEAELDAYFIEVRERGFEGLMVKSTDHTYQKGKRIDGWLKMKPEETFDGKIVKINEAVSVTDKLDDLGGILVPAGTPLGRAGSVDVLLEDGSTASPAGIEWGLGVEMWQHPERFVGQWVEFKCMERDRQGGYRHPSVVRLREAKA